MDAHTLIRSPARPIQGGRLELAPPKRGLWYAEPKLNGRRALVHTPNGTSWNRYGALLLWGIRLLGRELQGLPHEGLEVPAGCDGSTGRRSFL